jgi:hypothetical protein
VHEDRLEELYEVVKIYSRTETENNGESLFSKLKKISIDGPEDFSANVDGYNS